MKSALLSIIMPYLQYTVKGGNNTLDYHAYHTRPIIWLITIIYLYSTLTVYLLIAIGVSDQVRECFWVCFPAMSVMILMSSRHKIRPPSGRVAIVGSKCFPVENKSVALPVLTFDKNTIQNQNCQKSTYL
jgi:hypothetical protein